MSRLQGCALSGTAVYFWKIRKFPVGAVSMNVQHSLPGRRLLASIIPKRRLVKLPKIEMPSLLFPADGDLQSDKINK
jgi:hypothetical protein